MRLPMRIRKENDNQKYCIVAYNTAFGKVNAHTFLTDKEIEKLNACGFDCQPIQANTK
jgi:hypothetical protein